MGKVSLDENGGKMPGIIHNMTRIRRCYLQCSSCPQISTMVVWEILFHQDFPKCPDFSKSRTPEDLATNPMCCSSWLMGSSGPGIETTEKLSRLSLGDMALGEVRRAKQPFEATKAAAKRCRMP
jgi:hypothetical protein